MTGVLLFIGGAMFGGTVGVIVVSLLRINRERKGEREKKQRNKSADDRTGFICSG